MNKIYKCPFCGGILEANENTKSVKCSFCDSIVNFDDDKKITVEVKYKNSVKLNDYSIRKALIDRGLILKIPKEEYITNGTEFGFKYFLNLYELNDKIEYLSSEEKSSIEDYKKEARDYIYRCLNGKITKDSSLDSLLEYQRMIDDVKLVDNDFSNYHAEIESQILAVYDVASKKDTTKKISGKAISFIVIGAIIAFIVFIAVISSLNF